MKRTKYKIILIVILSNLIISILIGTLIVLNTFDAFKDVAIKKAVEITKTEAHNFDEELITVRDIAITTEIYIESQIDLEAIENQANYLDDFEVKISPMIKNLATTGIVTQSAYVFFDPNLDGQVHDVWYTDLNHDGKVTRQEEFDKSFYDNVGEGDEWFTVPFYGHKPYWTPPYYGSVEFDKDVIYVSHTRPVQVNDKIIGVVGSDYHFDIMKERIESLELYNTGYGMLVTEKGEIIVHPTIDYGVNLETYNGGTFAWMLKEMDKKDDGIFRYKWINGNDKFLAYQRLENGWVLAITLEEKEIFAWYNRLIIVIILMTLLLTTLITVLSFRLSHRITDPLDELSNRVAVMNQNEYGIGIPLDILNRSDELGVLGKSIENMRVSIKSVINEISSYSSILEKKVADRSQQIVIGQKELEEAIEINLMQNKDLKALNDKLEGVIKTLAEAQLHLIESEKIASMNDVMTRLVSELKGPIGNFNDSLTAIKNSKEKVDNKLRNKLLKHDDMILFADQFDYFLSSTMGEVASIKQLVEKFKAMNPDSTYTTLSYINMSDFLHVIIDSLEINESIDLIIECDKDIELTIDSLKLSQVIVHLVDNALIHAFDDQGLITIKVTYMDKLMISVKDNGRGISPHLIDRMFNPSHAMDDDFGYGLNIVNNIVQKTFKGSIKCISQLGQGSDFTIEINI